MKTIAIRPHLNGRIEISHDQGKTWEPFDGIVVNAALTEHMHEMNELRRIMTARREEPPFDIGVLRMLRAMPGPSY